LELKNRLENHEDFRVIYDGEDFGIYKYIEERNRYEGCIGHITIQSMLDIINGKCDFIELK
jgi:hypothetical protein